MWLKPGRFQLPWPHHVTCLWWYRLRVGLNGECQKWLQSVTVKARSMSPAFQAGISRVPEYHKFLMQPNDQWYAIVASDGIWDPWLDTSLRLLDRFSYSSGREKISSYLWLLISGLHTLKFIMVVTVSFSWIFEVTHMVVLRNLGQHKSFTDPRSSLKAKIAATWLRRSFD